MREIKFRAWYNGKYYYNPELEFVNSAQKYFIRLLNNNDIKFPVLSTTLDDNCFILEQYTGLKDKNGKEIYELTELNNKYIVIYILTGYFLYDIVDNAIRNIEEEIFNGFIPKITREYSPLSQNQERVIDEYISSSKMEKYC